MEWPGWYTSLFQWAQYLTFAVALTAKSAYLLAMTGVVIPSIKDVFKGKTPLKPYKDAFAKSCSIYKLLKGNSLLIGLALTCAGAAMAASILLSRNGKIDKSFILILLAFTLFKSLSGSLPSVLYIILRKFAGIFIVMLPGGLNNVAYLDVAFFGMMAGFLVTVISGNMGTNAGYILGAVLVGTGIVLMKGNK